MTTTSGPGNWGLGTFLLAAGAALALTGCAAPPSVVPLLELTGAALKQESRQIHAQARRDRAYFDQARRALADGFEADLAGQDTLTAAWVEEALAGYLPAREALAKAQAGRARQRARRIDNLAAAGQAQQRAIQLLQRQDKLVVQGVGLNLWRQLRGER